MIDSSPERYTVINISLCQLHAGQGNLYQSHHILISVFDSSICGQERGRISPSFDKFTEGLQYELNGGEPVSSMTCMSQRIAQKPGRKHPMTPRRVVAVASNVRLE